MNHQIQALELVPKVMAISIGNSKNMRAFVDNEGGIWFCLVDVLEALESKSQTNNVSRTITDIFGDGCLSKTPIQDALGRMQNVTFAHESATTYSLDKGFLVVKQIEDAAGKVRNQTLVTPKGFIELARLKKAGLIPAEFFVSED